jgi:hypothetical protein
MKRVRECVNKWKGKRDIDWILGGNGQKRKYLVGKMGGKWMRFWTICETKNN